jgi:transglutaminase-like putative cysteine protease
MLRRGLLTLAILSFSLAAHAQKERHFVFHYSFRVNNVPAGQSLRVWIPRAHSDSYQEIRVLSKTGGLALRSAREDEYGNSLLYAETAKAAQSEYQFTVDYDVIRHEEIVLMNGKPASPSGEKEIFPVLLTRFEQPDKLVPVTGLPAQLATEQTKSAHTNLDKARAIYDYVFHTLRYDKSGTGWGHGDTLWACDSKRGNCTDFHSLFISMARSQRIPARFAIGFQLPADKHSAEVPGYHCWADFYVESAGWIPVDISEAWKHPELQNYYFGQRDPDRIQFTVGRDLVLTPRQAGPPLNYFVYPYVEVGGKEYPNVEIAFSFEGSESTRATAAAPKRTMP